MRIPALPLPRGACREAHVEDHYCIPTSVLMALCDANEKMQIQSQIINEQTQAIEDLVAELLAHSIRQPTNDKDKNND